VSEVLHTLVKNVQQTQTRGRGAFILHGLMNAKWTEVPIIREDGTLARGGEFKRVIGAAATVNEVLRPEAILPGVVLMRCNIGQYPLEPRTSHLFRQLALSMIACYPGIMDTPERDDTIRWVHSMEDPHHTLECSAHVEPQVLRRWGSTTTQIDGPRTHAAVEKRVAAFLGVKIGNLWITPHHRLTQFMPTWTGTRRWKSARKRYKLRFLERRLAKAGAAMSSTVSALCQTDPALTHALGRVAWTSIKGVVGASGYQRQIIHRLKAGKLRLWRNSDLKFRCILEGCVGDDTGDMGHLVWRCPSSKTLWQRFADQWNRVILDDQDQLFQ
jgi:hypothetical protein